MDDVGGRIRRKRVSLGLSQEELAEMVGYKSKSTINKIESGANAKRGLDQTKIKAFAKALNTTPAYLMGWEETKDVDLPTPEVTRTINIYEPLSCGSGLFVDDNLVTTMSVPESMLPKGKKVLFGQYASGDSMVNKGINDGDLLIFSKEECVSGDVGCFCIDENVATCKTLRIVGQQIMLMPANEKYEPIVVDPMNFKCVGKLVLVINKRWDEN